MWYWPRLQKRHSQHGHDLFGDHPVADRDAPPLRGLVVEFHHEPDELVTGDHHGLRPRRAVLVAPELRGTVIALQVTGTDADSLDPDQRLARPALGHRDFLESVVLRSVTYDCLHFFGDLFGHLDSLDVGLTG